MFATLVGRLVELGRRHAPAVAVALVLTAALAGYYALRHLTIDTNVEDMLPANLAWRQQELALDRAFPQNRNPLVIVIDGRTPERADEAAELLAKGLGQEPGLFNHVRRPDGGDFFAKNGILFASREEVRKTADDLIKAQPLLGELAHDPSLRGLFGALGLFALGAERGDVPAELIDPALDTLDQVVREVLAGEPAFLSWQRLLTGKPPAERARRRFILAQPVLDYAALEPGKRARDEVHRLAAALRLGPQTGVRVRITGPVALNDAQFADLQHGALRSALLSIGLVCVILFLALRSFKLVAAILLTLSCGLLLTAGFAGLAVGSLNPISIAFAVLFVGLATDFSLQFSIRYRSARHHLGELSAALATAGRWACGALLLAAGATAIGFFSFLPTNYKGVAQLGLIAGAGMIIGVMLNFLLLPALLTLLRPAGEPQSLGFRWAGPIDRLLLVRRRSVLLFALLLAALGVAALPFLHFDFDPLALRNPKSEAVETLEDLTKDPVASPYAAEILAPSLASAEGLAARLSQLPQVAQTLTLASFIPRHQKEKLASIADLSLLIGPTLSPPSVLPAPSLAAVRSAIEKARDALEGLAAKKGANSAPGRFARTLDRVLARGPKILPPLAAALTSGMPHELALLRKLIAAGPVTLESLPPDLRRSWMTPDGRARVEVSPQGNVRDRTVLRDFVRALRTIAPNAAGTAVTIQEIGRMVTRAFAEAGAIGIAAIALLLWLILHRLRDVAYVIAPLALAAILTLATTVVLGIPLNYANIIALPLLFGIGVAFDIYFVMNWRAGVSEHLQSSTARAVLFSALTTMSAFGSLALSADPGLADIGLMLVLSLGYTLFSTLVILPALLGRAPQLAGDRPAVRERPGRGRLRDLHSR